MPKTKLSDKQRRSLRSGIRRMLSNGRPKNEIMTALSQKYGIGKESVRWYLKSIDGSGTKPPKTESKAKPATAKAGPKRRRRRTAGAGRDVLKRALSEISGLSDRDIKRVLDAKRLKTELGTLADRRKKTRGELRSIETSIRKLKTNISRLLRK